MPTQQKSAYQRWYERNKEKVSERRRKRYRNDPEFRKKKLQYRKEQSMREKIARRKAKPEKYVYTTEDVEQILNISNWKIRRWREEGLTPEPYTHFRKHWYTETQVELMGMLNDFMESIHGREENIVGDKIIEFNDLKEEINKRWLSGK